MALRRYTYSGAAITAGVVITTAALLLAGCGSGGGSKTVALTGSGTPKPITATATQYQINPSHTGFVSFGQPLHFPSQPTWSVALSGTTSYPLIVGGRIFVTATQTNLFGTNLYALDKATGATAWGPIPISGPATFSRITYDNGKVFVLNVAGLLQSFDAATGTLGWSIQMPGLPSFYAPPTAANGTIYIAGSASGGGALYAVNEASGAINWSQSVEYGDFSSPTLPPDGSAVFVSYPCETDAFNPQSGATLWHYNGSCRGGGGATAVYANGQLYARSTETFAGDASTIFDATTGNVVGTFTAHETPALDATNGYFLSLNVLRGINQTSHQTLWSFTGDGKLNSAPIEIDKTVFIGSASGTVYALDSTTGAQIWSADASMGNEADYFGSLAAGEGYLATTFGNRLTVWHLAGS